MPWKCLACETQIMHPPTHDLPRLDTVYRCPVCRLELTFDPTIQKMKPAPFPPNNHDHDRKIA